MPFEQFLNPRDFVTLVEFLISIGIGLFGLSFAICLRRHRNLKSTWYASLRHILALLSITALSNAWSALLMDHADARPTELFMNVSLLVLIGWGWCYYRYHVMRKAGPCSLEKLLKFIHTEVSGRPLRAHTRRL